MNSSFKLCSIGLYGVSSGAPMAARTTSASKSSPVSSSGLSPIFCRRMLKLRRSIGWISGSSRVFSAFSLIRHPRVEERIRQVYGQIDDNHQDGTDDGDRLHDGVIAARDGCEQQMSHPRHREHGLDDERAAHQETELEPENGDS